MNEPLQKIRLNILKLGVAVAPFQLANQPVRGSGSEVFGDVVKGIRTVRYVYQAQRQAA